MNLDESQCLGCVYIDPTNKSGYDAEVYMWVRKSEYDKGLDPVIFDELKNWMNTKWPFNNVAYPGREIDWSEWNTIPEK
jgi:hypothetical protein